MEMARYAERRGQGCMRNNGKREEREAVAWS